jgi:hypothetical protein
MITTRYGQVFYPEEANDIVGEDTCTIFKDGKHNHDTMECDWCFVYYQGPQVWKEEQDIANAAP